MTFFFVVSVPVVIFTQPFLFLFASFSRLNAVELEGAEEGDSEGDGDGLPFDWCATPGFGQPRGEGLFAVLLFETGSGGGEGSYSSRLGQDGLAEERGGAEEEAWSRHFEDVVTGSS